MALLLGVDTGGTYTDAVLIEDETRVVGAAKALTTRHDLAIGIGAAIRSVLTQSGRRAEQVALAALSTTLATNALVEGQGGRVGLVSIGFRPEDLSRHGVSEALNGDRALAISGGHSHAGTEAAALDIAALDRFLRDQDGTVSGYAVAAQFATRNPAHELEVARVISERTGTPVTCSHQLSARLNGPKRAVTAVLNARLIGMIDRLISRAEAMLRDLGITAPMMVVRGDGALMSARQARSRPIETILSGPAASIIGAHWLTGVESALVSDIGGTTTDVALIQGGKPRIDPDGARVGRFRTMVEAVAMRTTGLGGDSQVHLRASGLSGGVLLGPRRVVPVSLIATEAPDVVHDVLDAQLRFGIAGENDAKFVQAVSGLPRGGLDEREQRLLDRIGDRVCTAGDVLRSRMEQAALNRLVDRGHVMVAAPTPSDACHVLGHLDSWDRAAAEKALELLSRRRIGSGDRVAAGSRELAEFIVLQLTKQTADTLLEAVFAQEPATHDESPEALVHHPLLAMGLSGHRGLVALDAALNIDVVGLGASAPTYYPAVGKRLNCRVILPDYAGVANAIGAVAGRIVFRRSGTVTSPSEGKYRAHLANGPTDFSDPDSALALLEAELKAETRSAALAAGADELYFSTERDIRTARVESREVFVEGTLSVEASGRPRVAVD